MHTCMWMYMHKGKQTFQVSGLRPTINQGQLRKCFSLDRTTAVVFRSFMGMKYKLLSGLGQGTKCSHPV